MSNFLTDYLDFNSGNEANRHYHFWCGISALASLVSRKVWLDFGYFRVYPAMYIVLLGQAGNKKTTAMDVAKDLLREVGGIPFSAECQSKENLVKFLCAQTQAFQPDPTQPAYTYTPLCIFVTELSQFIGIDPMRMVDFLVTVYDRNWYDMSTQKHGMQAVPGPYINLLGCTVPEWITSYLKTDIITGGFSRRCIFVLEEGTNQRIPFPCITPDMRAAWARCVAYGHKLATVYGEFTWDAEAKEYYTSWYKTREITKDPNVANFDSTKFIQVLKVAMCLSLAESTDLVIRPIHLTTAIEQLDNVMSRLPDVFRGLGRNVLATVGAKLESHLRRAGAPVSERECTKLLWNDARQDEISQIINHLVSTGAIVRTVVAQEIEVPDSTDKTKTVKCAINRAWLSLPERKPHAS